jgi:hypothetical protein
MQRRIYTRDLIGTPYVPGGAEPQVGLDCWHLAAIVVQRATRLQIPAGVSDDDARQIGQQLFAPVPRGTKPQPGDVLTFRAPGAPFDTHCVAVVDDRWGLDVRGERPVHRIRIRRLVDRSSQHLRPDPEGTTLADTVAGPETLTAAAIAQFIVYSLIATAISVGLAFLIPRDTPDVDVDNDTAGPTYSWAGISTSRTRGRVVPLLYGEHATGGQLIQQSTRADQDGYERLYLLLCLGHGQFAEIAGREADFDQVDAGDLPGKITINGNDLDLYEGVKVSGRMGTLDQSAIPGFNETVAEYGAGNFALVNTSGSDRSGDDDAEAYEYSTVGQVSVLALNLQFPQGLYRITDQGAFTVLKVEWRYRYRRSDTGSGPGLWSSWVDVTTKRRHTGRFLLTRRQSMPTRDYYDVQVQRVTADRAGERSIDDLEMQSVGEISGDELIYPGLALLAIEAVATEQLNTNRPNVVVWCKGRKVPVWDGVDPDDPDFPSEAWTQNPAYIARDLLTNNYFGMGRWLPSNMIDDAALVEWAQACEVQADLLGDQTEDLCHFDGVFDQELSGWDALLRVCRAGRAAPLAVGSRITFKIDAAADVVQVFSDGNIVAGSVSITYQDRGQRPNAITCQYLDASDDYRSNTFEREDPNAAAAGDLYRPESISLFGVTRRTQVARDVLLRLQVARNVLRTISFDTSAEALTAEVGDVVALAHHVPQWGSSGRVSAGTGDTITLDRSITMSSANSYRVLVRHADDTFEIRNLINPGGDGSYTISAGDPLRVTAPFDSIPAAGDVYVVGVGADESGGKWIECRIAQMAVQQDTRIRVTCREYIESVYDDELILVDLGDDSGLVDPGSIPGVVTDLSLVEQRQDVDGDITRIVVNLAWEPPRLNADLVAHYEAYYREVGSTGWAKVPTPFRERFAEVGSYVDDDSSWEFTVVAIAPSGAHLHPDDCPRVSTALGFAGDPPPAPTPISDDNTGNEFTLSWDAVDEAVGYEVRLAAGDLRDGALLGRTTDTEYGGLHLSPGRDHQFFVRSYNRFGRHTLGGTSHTITGANVPAPITEAVRTATTFTLATNGTLTNLTWDAGDSRLELIDNSLPGVWESSVTDTSTLEPGGIYPLIDFELKWLDRGGGSPQISDMALTVVSAAGDVWQAGEPARPAYPDAAYGITVEIRHSADNVDWTAYEAVDLLTAYRATFRYYQLRVTITTTDPLGLLEPTISTAAATTTEAT